MRTEYTKADLDKFHDLLCVTELKGMGNYARNIGRMKLKEWLTQFDKKTADEMFEKIKDRK